MNRRSFLQSILAAGVAPAFVGSSVLMPVMTIITPQWGITDSLWLPPSPCPADPLAQIGYFGCKVMYDGVQYGASYIMSRDIAERSIGTQLAGNREAERLIRWAELKLKHDVLQSRQA